MACAMVVVFLLGASLATVGNGYNIPRSFENAGLAGSAGLAQAGKPLFLSEYLPNDFSEAQKLSRIDLSSAGWNGTTAMHSGFITLDKQLGKNTFFWYSESLDGNADAPLLLWLTGGPGASSLFALFTELGPIQVTETGKVEARPITWNQHHHMVFVDNPVGTGFSFTESDSGFAKNETQVGADLYNFLSQFFQLFPNLRTNDFYVTGESYAGKYVPACAFTVHEQNRIRPQSEFINLKGISIGDGAFNPPAQFQGFGDLLWSLGMVDESEKQQFKKYEAGIQAKLQANDHVGAFRIFDEMINGDFFPYPTYYANVTGMSSNYFNFDESPDATPLGGSFVAWLNTPAIRAKVHVGDRIYAPYNRSVEEHLLEDWMQGVVPMLVPLMENYKVLIYSGQNDIILGPSPTENALFSLDWAGKHAYQSAKKIVWRRSALGPGSKLADVAGYAREVDAPGILPGKFTQVVIRDAGHMAPGDQPARALDMIERFIRGRSFATKSLLDEPPSSTILV